MSAIGAVLLLTPALVVAQVKTLDPFESTNGWSFIRSDGVNLNLSVGDGLTGKALRFDYDFTKGTGYGGIQKLFPTDLPDNYEFTFYLKAESPANNLEIKFIDSTGNNVWWVVYRRYTFPGKWTKIRVKKRHIQFAWGPTTDQQLKRVDRLEFTVSSVVGGKGTLWFDDLEFEPLPPERSVYPAPTVSASSSLEQHSPSLIIDGSDSTSWQARTVGPQDVLFDFTMRREFGGLQIDWLKAHRARQFDVDLSEDGQHWDKAYSVASNGSDVSLVRLPEAEARFLKLHLGRSAEATGVGISEVKFLDIKDSATPNDFFIYAAKHSPEGDYPRYFLEQASYWTITGVNNDVKEGLLNVDGMVEVDKGLFSLEPGLKVDGRLYNWSNVKAEQSMGTGAPRGEFEFVPSVSWQCGDVKFVTSVMASGEANLSSLLGIRYAFENHSPRAKSFEFYLLLRPFQVNPYYQFLNQVGGVGKIRRLKQEADGVIAADDKVILSQRKDDGFGALAFDEGNVVDLLRNDRFPVKTAVVDDAGLAAGVLRYSISLRPGERTQFFVAVPFYGRASIAKRLHAPAMFSDFEKSADFWRAKVNHIKFNLPPSADRIVNTYKTTLAYILVNRDKAGIQPGSRSYERSWIRDGSLTSSALLKSGIVPEVRDFINWYAGHQYENGKVPCVVDSRGPDPVPENDSCGELIYAIREYYNFTKDIAFLQSKNENVLKAVAYLESMIAQQSTDAYKSGDDTARAEYGLVPESISHEGYSAKPMHSYWDDFFTMKGLKDAAEIQRLLGDTENYERVKKVRDTFRENLYKSLELAMRNKKIDYIPGCVELGDFDATSTTIALTPCNELNDLPKPQVYNTFDKYYDFFKQRRDGQLDWVNYTPYENRLIGSFIILDQPERAHELIEFFLKDQRPQAWHQWAEVVWRDPRTPKFIGDMPHTWVGSDFVNAIRSLFVYENEYDQSLVLGAGLYQDWLDAPEGMSIEHLPTYYGELSYAIRKHDNRYVFSISGELTLPANGIKIKNFNGGKRPVRVTIGGVESQDFTENEIRVKQSPAEVVIEY